MKVVVATFNQEKALVGAFSMIVQPVVEPMEHYTALITTLCLFLLIEGLVDIDINSWNYLLCRYVELGGMARVNLFSDRSFLKSRHF